MLRSVRAALVLLLLVACSLAAQAPSAAQIHDGLVGHWVGKLEYKDYSNPDKRVTLPTIVDAAVSPKGGVALHFIYDDGPGKTVTGDDAFTIAADGSTLDWTGVKEKEPAIFRVTSLAVDSTARSLRMVVEREGEDDRKPATLRETITLSETEWTILKEVRPGGAVFAFRHQYSLRRQ